MTYTETQLEAIRLFGKKDLTKWNICLMNNKNKLFPDAEDTLLTFFWFVDWEYFFIDEHLNQYSRYTENFEILWHIPHLEDLFRVAEEQEIIVEIREFPREENSMITFQRHPIYKQFPYIRSQSLLDQPNLSDIISLFR